MRCGGNPWRPTTFYLPPESIERPMTPRITRLAVNSITLGALRFLLSASFFLPLVSASAKARAKATQ